MKGKLHENCVKILLILASIMLPIAMAGVSSCAWREQMAVIISYQHKLAECDLE